MELPTDDQFIEELYTVYKDEPWVSFMTNPDIVNATNRNTVRDVLDAGYYAPSERREVEELAKEISSPSRSFQGRFIAELRQSALPFLGQYRNRVAAIPIALAPTRELNACVLKTPRGGFAILLDSGVFIHLMVLVQSFLAFMDWRSSSPFCRDHSQKSFARTLILLAEYCVSGSLKRLSEITTLVCPSRPRIDKEVITHVNFIEWFILLHEYGHVVLNHLSPERTYVIEPPAGAPLNAYRSRPDQELEADAFAFKQIQETSKDYLRPTEIAFYIGILLRFLDLCEAVVTQKITSDGQTHPPAYLRWQRIKTIAGVSEEPKYLAAQLDRAFDVILRGYQAERRSAGLGTKGQ